MTNRKAQDAAKAATAKPKKGAKSPSRVKKPLAEPQVSASGQELTDAKTPKERALAPMQRLFVDEYLKDLNASQAALRAGYSAKTAGVIGYQLLQKPLIEAAIAAAQAERSKEAQITSAMVLARYWMIATADANELIEHRRVCCRHCFGKDFLYQWVDPEEYDAACVAAEGNDEPIPSDEGGFGYDRTERPHPKCPHCKGEGFGRVHAHDTRHASPAAKALYAGVKQTKEGFEIKTHDQLGALNMVARHLGMFNDKLLLGEDKDNPLSALLKEVAGKTLKPGGDQ